ncbi:MAG: hypothetical protein ACI4B5_08750 [Bacteroidaceae bacterium]
MALADGGAGYTPPSIIRQMREELHWLPLWWADDGDKVWNGEDPLVLKDGDEIHPWGWSPALAHQLRQSGVEDRFLPTDEQLQSLRMLSHRQTAVEALKKCRENGLLGKKMAGWSMLCHTEQEVEEAVTRWPEVLMKAPWSSSGRGLMRSSAPHRKEWTRNILNHQGSVVVERWLNKLADFALEFECDGQGGVQYQGLSLFYTNPQGAYMGNWVAPEIQKFQWIAQYVDPAQLMEVRRWWEEELKSYPYKGPVGIDMMLCQEGLCPCIEINWRMTMGRVACILHGRGKYGRLVVEYIYGHYSAEVESFG